MNLVVVVHIKSSYDEWKRVFDDDQHLRINFVDESRTLVGKVSERMALVKLFGVNIEKMMEHIANPHSEVADIIGRHVIQHDIYKTEEFHSVKAS